jgi:hypothetical protein
MKIFTHNIITIVSILFLLSSCSVSVPKNEHEGKSFQLEGTIYRDCAKTIPFKNGKLIVNHRYTVAPEAMEQTEISKINTDENGDFMYEYKAHYLDDFILASDSGKVKTNFPRYINANLGSINLFEKNAQIVLKIKTNKVFTNADNLSIEYLKFSLNGPFLDGQIIDTLEGHFPLVWENNKFIISVGFYYHLNGRASRLEQAFETCKNFETLYIDIDRN